MHDIKIIYEDNDVVVINKPSGLSVHPDGKHEEETVSGWMIEKYPESQDVGEPLRLQSGETVPRPGVVHRLDKETSGVMILAKTQVAFEFLKEQFQNREVEKVYNTFVYGVPKEKEGVIDRPIGRSAQDPRKRSAQRGAKGEMREAVTRFSVIKEGTDVAFLEVRPKTGRMHQIRVHLKAINHQVVCDKLYAPKRECMLGFRRLALHARRLTIVLPSGEKREFEAPLPEDFENALLAFK